MPSPATISKPVEIGHISNLVGYGKLKTWSGWVIYYWDMGYNCALFASRPKQYQKNRWEFRNAVEGISPFLLRALGVTVPFDDDNDRSRNKFYYGDGLEGEHPPIRIKLTMPEILFYQLKL